MNDEWIGKKYVQEMFLLTKFGRVMRNIKRRYKYDYYSWIKRDKEKKTKMYVDQECVD